MHPPRPAASSSLCPWASRLGVPAGLRPCWPPWRSRHARTPRHGRFLGRCPHQQTHVAASPAGGAASRPRARPAPGAVDADLASHFLRDRADLRGAGGGPCSARSMAPGLCPGPWQGVAVPSRAVRDSASLDRQGRPVPPSGRWTVVWCGLSPCGPSCTCLSRAGAVGGGACGRAGPSLGRRHRRWTPRPSLCVGSGKPSWPVASGRSLVTLVPARDTCEAVLRWRPHKWHHLVAARWRGREQSGLGNRYLDHLLLSPAGKLRQRGSGASPGSPTGKRQAQPGAGRPSRCSGCPLGGGGAQQGHSG